MTPRPYQLQAIQDARNAFINNYKHICICLSVGAGKSLIAKTIIEQSLGKNKKIGFFSFRTVLIEQMQKHFKDNDNLTFGTMQKYGKDTDTHYDLCIFDEKDYHDTKLKNNISCDYSITLSGTPVDEKGNVLKFDYICEGVQLPDLVKMGFAKPIKVLSTSKVDTSQLKISGKDFHKGQSFKMMEKSSIKKDLVDVYNKYCIGRKTLLFAIDTKHAESLKDEFTNSGIKCEAIHSKKSNDNVLKDFEYGKFDLLINVAMISVGVDIPSINTIMFARPMASIPLMIQCVGRATRINPNNKDDYCLILDCAEVMKRCNFHPMQKLDLKKTKATKKVKTCCNVPMSIYNTKTQKIDDLSYKVINQYRCSVCNNSEDVERVVIANLSFCSGCDIVLTGTNVEMIQKDKSLDFIIKCENCGYENVQRSVILTDKELKEIEHIENLNSDDDWIKIRAILKDESKRCNYMHQWVNRCMDSLRGKNIDTKIILEKIKELQDSGSKIGRIMYI